MRLLIKFDEEQMVRDGILEEGELSEWLDAAREPDEYGCFEILNMEFTHGRFILNEGFDIQFATDQVSEYEDCLDDDMMERPMYYMELMNRNDYLGDDAAYDYCGSYVSKILDMINWALEIGSYEEINA